MQEGGCIRGCTVALCTPFRSAPSRGQGRGCRARRVSGHWPDRVSSAAASMALTETGTPDNVRGVAREAETAPDTPAFLKNEKSYPHPPFSQERKIVAFIRCSKPRNHLGQKCSNAATACKK